MKITAIIRSTVAGLSLLGFMAFGSLQAQTATPVITKNQVQAQRSIVQGTRTGDLTRQEARKLRRQQARINRSKQRASADGTVTKRESNIIRARQRNARRDIRQQKNDRQTRRN